MAKTPSPPAAPRKRLPRPFKAGDKVLDKRDIVGQVSMNTAPPGGVIHTRGVTRREERDVFLGAKDYRRSADREIRRGRRENQRRASASRR